MARPARFVRIAAAALFTLALWPVSAQDPPSSPPGQVFRGAVDFVRVDAYPRRDGRVVEGLTAADFTILEDGQPQVVDTFEFVRHAPEEGYDRVDPRNRAEAERWLADPRRRVFIIYLDLYHISRAASHLIRGPLMDVLSETIGPSDVVAVMTSETPVGDLAYTQTLNTISAEIEQYWEWGLAEPPIQPRTPAEQQLTYCGNAMSGFDDVIRQFRDDVFFTSLESLIAHVGALRQDRTNVILLSEGWRNRRGGIRIFGAARDGRRDANRTESQFGRPGVDQFGRPSLDTPAGQARSCAELLARLEIDYEDRFRRLYQAANANNVSFHTIDVGGLRTGATTAESRDPRRTRITGNTVVLQELAENTDGLWAANQNDIGVGLRRIVDRTSSYYLLGYASTNTATDGRFRKIEVRVDERGIDVTARRGYFGVSSDMQERADERNAREAVPSPVALALGGLTRWDNGDGLLAAATVESDTITVLAELSPREVSGGRWRGGADIAVEVVDASGVTTKTSTRLDPGRSSLALDVPADGAGPWRLYLRAAVDDAEVSTRLTVSPPADDVLGTPKYFRIPAIGRPTPQPVVAPIFRRGERMRIEWRTSTPPASPAVALLDRRGQTLSPGAALTHAFEAQTGVLSVDLHVAALAEGDYAIEVTTGERDDAERDVVAFRVGR